MKKYILLLACGLLQSTIFFCAQVDSEDKKTKLLRELAKVEAAAAKVFTHGAVIGYEVPAKYRPVANDCMRMILGDCAPEKAALQDVNEEYDDLREHLAERSPTPGSEQVVKTLEELDKKIQVAVYAEGMGSRFKEERPLAQSIKNLLGSFCPW